MFKKQSSHDYAEEALYLKGLLKPFRGKEDYEVLELQAAEAREGVAAMMNEIADMWAHPPLSLLGIHTGAQPSSSGATHLRWRTRGRGQRMGVEVWSKTMQDKRTPEELLDELYRFEVLRLQTNMQMSCLQFIMKQARECQEKVDEAESVLIQAKAMRMQQGK